MLVLRVLFFAFLTTFVRSSPLELTDENFQENLDSGNPIFVKFYAPWCGHCKNLAPTWNQLADKYTDSNVLIAKVDCTSHTKICADQGVKGYPTLKLFQGGEVWDHRSARDLQTLSEFVNSHVAKEVKAVEPTPLTDNTFMDHITTLSGLHFVKFYAPWCGHCQRLAPTWIELAQHYHEDQSVHISKVDCTQETGTCSQYEVKGYPTLLLFMNGVLVESYNGNRDLTAFTDYLSEKLQKENSPVQGVRELTDENFESVRNGNGAVFVKFFAPWCGHCKRLAPTWEELAEAVHGSSSTTVVAKVDCTVYKDLCAQYGVHGYPTLVMFNGEQRTDYREARDLKSLLDFVQEHSG